MHSYNNGDDDSYPTYVQVNVLSKIPLDNIVDRSEQSYQTRSQYRIVSTFPILDVLLLSDYFLSCQSSITMSHSCCLQIVSHDPFTIVARQETDPRSVNGRQVVHVYLATSSTNSTIVGEAYGNMMKESNVIGSMPRLNLPLSLTLSTNWSTICFLFCVGMAKGGADAGGA